MTHGRRLAGVWLVAVAVAVAVAGCGGSESSEASTTGAPTTRGPAEGDEYADPQGGYLLTVPSGWRMVAVDDPEAEAWAVAPKRDGFTANVNILTQVRPGATLDGYLQFSVEELAELPNLAMLGQELVVGSDGQELGVLRYTATPGEAPITFLAYATVGLDRVVLATLTSLSASFEEVRVEVEPYLRTLRATVDAS